MADTLVKDLVTKYLKSINNITLEAISERDGPLNTEVYLILKDFSKARTVERVMEGFPFFARKPQHILISDSNGGGFRLIIPKDKISTVKFKIDSLLKPTYMYLGIDEKGEDLLLNLLDLHHVIIAGSTGSGKSMLIHSIIHSLLHGGKTEIVFIDPKKVESQMYAGLASRTNSLVTLASSPSDILNVLRDTKKWMENRYKYLAVKRSRDAMSEWLNSGFQDYNVIPRVLICDEVADIFNDLKEAKSEMLTLSSKARASGLRIFLATQRPDAKIIDGAIKANFTTRICLKTASRIDSSVVLGFGGAENLRGRGNGLLLKENGTLINFQGSMVPSIRMLQYTGEIKLAGSEEPFYNKHFEDYIAANRNE